MDKKVIAVVVTYNRKELLKECIEALLNQEYKCDVLIVDNNSTDGTKEYIDEYIKNNKIIYKNTGSNLGGAGGFNYGIKEAYKIGCDFIWIMDDDCITHKDTLSKLMEADNKLNGNYGFLSSRVLWKDGTLCRMNIQKSSLTKKIENKEKGIDKITMATFVSLFFKSSIVEEFGLPIKEFFIWSDDIEYTRRISKKYDCYIVNDSVVTHKSKDNVGSNIAEDSKERLSRYKYQYRNEVYIYKREGLKGRMYFLFRLALHIFRVIKTKNENKKERLKIIISSTKEGMKFNPKIEYIKQGED